jgi:NH3-dependent NAD+ synthetase
MVNAPISTYGLKQRTLRSKANVNFDRFNMAGQSIIEESKDDMDDLSASFGANQSNLDLNRTMTHISNAMEEQFNKTFNSHSSFKLKKIVKENNI